MPDAHRHVLQRLRHRLADRHDSEAEQAALRLACTAICLAYFVVIEPFDLRPELHDYRSIAVVLWSTMAVAIGIFAWLIADPRISPTRRLLAVVVDPSATTACLLYGGVIASPAYLFYLFASLGNGFRYGVPYLFASQALGIAGFLVACLFNEFWGSEPILAVALFLPLIVVPFHAVFLLRLVHREKQRAEQASAAKSRFVSTVSHEFRTPLNGIVGGAELLSLTALNREQRQLVDTLNNSATLLMGLVEGVLDLCRIEANRLELNPTRFAVEAFAREVISTVSGQARQKGLELQWRIAPDVPAELAADRKLLREIVVNLLANGVKFTREGAVDLTIGMAHEPPSSLRIEVRDSGIGIAPEDRERLFQPFTQLDQSASRRFGGAGLGTAISKELATAMGGAIGIHSAPARGTLFWICVPVSVPPGSDAVVTESLLRGRHYILIGLHGQSLDTLGRWITRWGGTVTSHATLATVLTDRKVAGDADFIVAHTVAPHDLIAAPSLIRGLPGAAGARVFVCGQIYALPKGLADASYTNAITEPLTEALVLSLLSLRTALAPISDGAALLAAAFQRLAVDRSLDVLVVEDNELNQLILKTWLTKAKHRVTTASLAAEMLAHLRQRAAEGCGFDLMLVDYNMPDIDGLEALRQYRAFAAPPYIPAIMISADAQPQHVRAASKTGYAAFISKPYRIDALAAEVHRVFKPSGTGAPTIAAGEEPAVDNDQILDATQWRSVIGTAADPHFAVNLRAVLLRTSRQIIMDIKAAAARGDMGHVCRLVHKLSGSAGTAGARRVHARCSALLASRHADEQSFGAMVAELERAVQELVDRLARADETEIPERQA